MRLFFLHRQVVLLLLRWIWRDFQSVFPLLKILCILAPYQLISRICYFLIYACCFHCLQWVIVEGQTIFLFSLLILWLKKWSANRWRKSWSLIVSIWRKGRCLFVSHSTKLLLLWLWSCFIIFKNSCLIVSNISVCLMCKTQRFWMRGISRLRAS